MRFAAPVLLKGPLGESPLPQIGDDQRDLDRPATFGPDALPTARLTGEDELDDPARALKAAVG